MTYLLFQEIFLKKVIDTSLLQGIVLFSKPTKILLGSKT